MKTLLAATLLAITVSANADTRPRLIQTMCGSYEDMITTMETYGEELVIASMSANKKTVNMVWVNFKTKTSTWFIHDKEKNEYCMAGTGEDLMIPKDSPLLSLIGDKI